MDDLFVIIIINDRKKTITVNDLIITNCLPFIAQEFKKKMMFFPFLSIRLNYNQITAVTAPRMFVGNNSHPLSTPVSALSRLAMPSQPSLPSPALLIYSPIIPKGSLC